MKEQRSTKKTDIATPHSERARPTRAINVKKAMGLNRVTLRMSMKNKVLPGQMQLLFFISMPSGHKQVNLLSGAPTHRGHVWFKHALVPSWTL